MRNPYKVIIWGPGMVGGACLRSVITLPEFELVGVLANSAAKIGKDAGSLVGMGQTGVVVTGDKAAIFGMEADCVIYTPADLGDFAADDEIIALLKSGKNVVTALPYHFPKLRGDDVVAKLEAACREGGVSLHASGSDPGFIGERLTLTLTGLCSEIKYITVEEVYECSLLSKELLTVAGFGLEPEQSEGVNALAHWADNYLRQVVAHAGHVMGIAFDSIEQTTRIGVAPDDFTIAGMSIKKGTVGAITNSWRGIVDGKPFYSLTNYWYLTEAMRPFAVPSRDHWIITVEGRPSARLTLDLKASIERDEYVSQEENAPAGMVATGIPLVQSIPSVCAHPAGIVYSQVFGHWKKDLRASRPI